MAVAFICAGCGTRLQLPEASAGRRFRCKRCDHVSRVPSAAPPAASDGFDPYGLDEKDDTESPFRKIKDDGDGLLGAFPVPPKPSSAPATSAPSEDVNPSRERPTFRKKRVEGADGLNVLGVPVQVAPWAFLAILLLLDSIPVLYRFGVNRWAGILSLIFLASHLVLVVVNALAILVTSRISDAEICSVRQVVSIAMAIAATTAAASALIRLAMGPSSILELVVNLVVSGSVLASSLRLGCLGVVGFMFVEMLVYLALFFLMLSLALNV